MRSGQPSAGHERWGVLAALFVARTSFGLQFQATAVTAPLMASMPIDSATLGTLMGAYMLPGVVLAVPGGVLGQRFGEKPVALAGLVLMAAGGLLVAMAGSPWTIGAGRFVSGAGAVLLNICVTTMLTYWFVGREMVLAMGVLASSWSMGVGLSFVLVPWAAAALSLEAALLLPVMFVTLAFLLIGLAYRPPPGHVPTPARLRLELTRREWSGSLLSGAVWGLFNAGFTVFLVFAPGLLIARGLSTPAAAATVSLANWCILLTLPLGGAAARLAGSARTVMVASFLTLAAVASGLALGLPGAAASILLGLVSGPVAGLTMSLPGQALALQNRAAGMGIYFGVYYVAVAALVPVAGWVGDVAGSRGAPLHVGGALMLAALGVLALFWRQQEVR